MSEVMQKDEMEFCPIIMSIIFWVKAVEGIAVSVKTLCHNCSKKNDCHGYTVWRQYLLTSREKLEKMIKIAKEVLEFEN